MERALYNNLEVVVLNETTNTLDIQNEQVFSWILLIILVKISLLS